MKPSIASTIALRSTPKAVALANKYNLHPTTHDDLIGALNQIISSQRDKGLKEIAMIHPDRELILSTAPAASSSCNGDDKCAKCSGKSSADGTASPETTNAPTGAAPSFVHAHQSTIITVVAIVAIAYIFKNH